MTKDLNRDVKAFLMSAEASLVEAKRMERRVKKLSMECEKRVRQEGLQNPSPALRALWALLEEERVREVEAVRREIALTESVRRKADIVINSTTYSTARLKGELVRLFGGSQNSGDMSVSVVSFGFKHGLPMEADLVLDAGNDEHALAVLIDRLDSGRITLEN